MGILSPSEIGLYDPFVSLYFLRTPNSNNLPIVQHIYDITEAADDIHIVFHYYEGPPPFPEFP
ncbi:hypothetical protein ES703_110691 [subsurface metagenome]